MKILKKLKSIFFPMISEKYVVIGFQGENLIHLEVSDCERALALASLLMKISTEDASFSNLQVLPLKNYSYETQKN